MTLHSLNTIIHISHGDAEAHVVLDTIVNNTSSGGVRIMDDISLTEIMTLAREMTLKFGFIGLPRGGAKSGIRLPAGISLQEKRRLLGEFGRSLSPIIKAGIYFPGMDMNCGPDDLRALYRGAGLTLGAITDTSFFTAISVANAIEACREIMSRDKDRLTVAIEGFGSVGCYLAQRLPSERYKIIAISTIKGAAFDKRGFDVDSLVQLRKESGDDMVNRIPYAESIERESLISVDADIFVPSARIWAINSKNISEIKARFIVPVANVPYTEDVIDELQRKNIVALPGFVANSGGVYASSLFDSGVSINAIENISSLLYKDVVASLLKKSIELRSAPLKIAERIAYERFKIQTDMHSPNGFYREMQKKFYRKGLFPKALNGKIVLKGFTENLKRLERQIAGLN